MVFFLFFDHPLSKGVLYDFNNILRVDVNLCIDSFLGCSYVGNHSILSYFSSAAVFF